MVARFRKPEVDGAAMLPRKRLRPAERRGLTALPRNLGLWLLAAFAGATAAAGVAYGGHAGTVASGLAWSHHVLARALGFGVERVTVTGIAELTPDEILTTGSIDTRRGLPFLDAAAIRDRIAEMPLVKSVSVQKLYPADLVITLSERKPFALWQLNGEVSVVSRDGVVIDKGVDARFAQLPLAVGEGANLRVEELAKLIEGAGELKPRIRAGTLIGERRWNLKTVNGIDVKLPEDKPAEALQRLAALQRKHRILDRDVLVIDLREPDRVTMRLTTEAADQRRESMKAKLGKWKGSNT
jgi:cell division protein FtsQ